MLARVMELWTIHSAQKAAIALLGPRVDGTRRQLGPIPQGAWLDPYIVGFITTLATIVAQRQTTGLGDTGLALVQSHVWSQLSGQSDTLIGSEIILLSLSDEPQFGRGCRAAMRFIAGLPSDMMAARQGWPGGLVSLPAQQGDIDLDRWPDFFDRRIETLLSDSHELLSRNCV